MIRVEGSSFIAGFDYLPESSTFVFEMFHQRKGEEYATTEILLYTGVPPCVFDVAKKVLAQGGSMGVFYNAQIKHYFSHVKVNREAWLKSMTVSTQ